MMKIFNLAQLYNMLVQRPVQHGAADGLERLVITTKTGHAWQNSVR